MFLGRDELRLSLIIFIFSLSCTAFAAKRNTSFSELQHKVKEAQREVDGLSREITRLEKDLGSKNTEYLEAIKIRQKLEARLVSASSELNDSKTLASEKSQKLRDVLKRLALQELDQNQNAAVMAARKILSSQVKSQLGILQQMIADSNKRDEELKTVRQRIIEYHETEQRLSELMRTMEERKKEQADAYLAAVGKKSEVEEKLSALKLVKSRKNVTRKAEIATRFSSPVEDFLGVEYDKKGITYKFTGRRPVVAVGSGEVAYSGRLSTYGNVVLIDHGDETRSVILGQFLPKMSKGQKVVKGEVLGYTENLSVQGKIYFEVRKGDKALDTVSLMDQNFLSKHRITKI